jgi:hypothetical protein
MIIQPPVIEKVQIAQHNGEFVGIPSYLKSHLTGVSVLYGVTVTPIVTRESTDVGPIRVSINAPNGIYFPDKSVISRTPTLFIDNRGRIGNTPAAGQDDFRPIFYYAWGTGTQILVISVNPNQKIYADLVI